MLRISSRLIALAAAFLAAPVLAQPQEVAIDADKDWHHQWTAMEFPAQLGEYTRNRITQFQERESDIAANYDGPLGDVLSIYVYRPGLADAAIWHDRALVALGANEAYRSAGVKGKRTTVFTPNGGTAQSGIMTVLATDGRFRSTSIALYSSGEWLVKLRLSSIRMEPDGMEAKLRSILAQMPEMKDLAAQEAYLIEPCFDEMVYSNAERFKPSDSETDGVNIMMLSLMGGIAEAAKKAGEESSEPAKYCREGEGGREGSIYRETGVKDRYWIAFGDSGTSAQVAPALSLDEIVQSTDPDAAKKAHFLVTYSTATANRIFMPFKSLPQPNQASQAVFREEPISTVTRPLGDEGTEVEVTSDALPDQSN